MRIFRLFIIFLSTTLLATELGGLEQPSIPFSTEEKQAPQPLPQPTPELGGVIPLSKTAPDSEEIAKLAKEGLQSAVIGVDWNELQPFSDKQLKGAYVGVQDNYLFVAGGETDEGYTNKIYVYKKNRLGEIKLLDTKGATLPIGMAHGVSVSSKYGLFCIGGQNHSGLSKRVYQVRWNKKTNSLNVKPLPSLPFTLQGHTADIVNDRIIIAGGSFDEDSKFPNRSVLEYNIKQLPVSKWVQKSCIPGAPRSEALCCTCSDGLKAQYHLLGGSWNDENVREFWSFDPVSNKWLELPYPEDAKEMKSLVIGGMEYLILFTKDQSYCYHTVTKTWTQRENLLNPYPTRNVVKWDKHFILTPGTESQNIIVGKPKSPYSLLQCNIIFFALYGISVLGIGFYFSRSKESADEYFRAKQKIPWWAAGISLFGTIVSSMSLLVYPAKAFASGWELYVSKFALILAIPFIASVYIPLYRRLNLTSVYEYLEMRFSRSVRALGVCIFFIYEPLRLGIVLYLCSVVLSISTGINVELCISAIAIISIVYTSMGGIEAVIWTDVLQVATFFVGLFFVIGYCLFLIPLPFSEMKTIAHDAEKLKMFDFAFDLTRPTFWVVISSCFIMYTTEMGTDQARVQRYLTTKNETEATKSLWTHLCLSLVLYLVLCIAGTLLYLFYKTQPQLLNPLLPLSDGIMAHFSATSLPPLLSSLFLTGIFAASMSTIDSGINSLATIFSLDFVKLLFPSTSDEKLVVNAKIASCGFGLVAMGLAFTLVNAPIISVFDINTKIVTFTMTSLGGVYFLGIFTKRVQSTAALGAFFLNMGVIYCIGNYINLHFLLVMGISPITVFIMGVVLSYVLPPSKGDSRFVFSNLEELKGYQDE